MLKIFARAVTLDFASKALNIFVTIWLISVFEPKEYAHIGIFLSLVSIITGGVINSLLKYELFYGNYRNVYILVTTTSIAVFLLLTLIINIRNEYWLLLFVIPCFIYIERYRVFLVNTNKMKNFYSVEFLRSFMFASLIFISMALGNEITLFYFVVYYLTSFAVTAVIYYIINYNHRKEPLSRQAQMSLWRKVLEQPHLYLYFFTITFSFQLDIILLSHLVTEEELGNYNAAYRIYMIMLSVTVVFQNFVLAAVKSKSAINHSVKYVLYCFAILQFLAAFIYFNFILNNKYPDSIYLLAILTLSCCLTIYYSERVNRVLCKNKFKEIYKIALLSGLLNLVLQVILITGFGAFGAAFATLVALWFMNSTIAKLGNEP